MRLLNALKRLADEGQLFEPQSVEATLQIQLALTTVDTGDQPTNCSDIARVRRAEEIKGKNAGESWFRALPTGAGHVSIPAFAINGESISGDPVVAYSRTRRIACSGRFGIRDHTQATLSLDGLPAFACMSVEDIQRSLPGAKVQMATDGVSLVTYAGRVDDASGTTLEFFYRAGIRCALSAQVQQDQASGLRFRRADYKRRTCKFEANKAFCAAHPGITWSNGDKLDEMDRHADSVCGEIDALYAAEPDTGVSPPVLPRRSGGPCD